MACDDDSDREDEEVSVDPRTDGATRLFAPQDGSYQNAAWSPSGTSVLFTHFRNGYNEAPADLQIVDLGSGMVTTLVSADDGSANVNLPGSSTTWTGSGTIIFSGDRDNVGHDEAYTVDATTGVITRVTDTDGMNGRPTGRIFEPSISPNGDWMVFEVHALQPEESAGVLYVARTAGTLANKVYIPITQPSDNCRQPVWSPQGDRIVYQKGNGVAEPDTLWDVWVVDASMPASMSPNTPRENVTQTAAESETDASWSPNGNWIVFSKEPLDMTEGIASIFIVAAEPLGAIQRVTTYGGYDGAPGWSSDGTRIAFESHPSDPDGSAGTSLWVINVPVNGL